MAPLGLLVLQALGRLRDRREQLLESVHDAERALHAALGMQRAVRDINKRWSAQGRPTISVGIGINYGEVFAAARDMNRIPFYLDQTGNQLKVRVKYSGGALRTGTVNLV